MQFTSLSIKDIRHETDDCVSIAFDIPSALQRTFTFVHGQNITLKAFVDGEEIRRSYSICSSPHENELRIAVKKVESGKFSAYANTALRIGDHLEVLPPTGKFSSHLDSKARKQYLAFTAGSGITPVISILKTILAAEPMSSFTLIYGNRTRASVIFREELEALKNRYMSRFVLHYLFSREHTDSTINTGRLDVDKCNLLEGKIFNLAATDEIFLCGPAEMIFAVKEWLNSKNVDPARIHFELFASPTLNHINRKSEKMLNGQPKSRVSIRIDGSSLDFDLPFDGDSILDGALRQGANLPYACKGGVCSTCRAKLTNGEIVMDSNYALEPDELAAGYILACQAHPLTPTVSLDFDAR